MDNKQAQPEKVLRNFINQDNVSKHLFCTICQEIFDNPYRLNCGYLKLLILYKLTLDIHTVTIA
jgi:hypothetical protein